MNENHSFRSHFHRLLVEKFPGFPEGTTERLVQFFACLHEQNQRQNLTGFKTVEEYFDYHFLDTVTLNQHLQLRDDARLLDVGTGAGIPGMVIKLLRPEVSVILIESSKKKSSFLSLLVENMKLDSTTVLSERAEDLAHRPEWRETMDCVTARALGILPVALELTAAFAKVGGVVALPRGTEETDAALETRVAEELGLTLLDCHTYHLPKRDDPHRLLFFQKCGATPEKYPRKPGHIKKRPL